MTEVFDLRHLRSALRRRQDQDTIPSQQDTYIYIYIYIHFQEWRPNHLCTWCLFHCRIYDKSELGQKNLRLFQTDNFFPAFPNFIIINPSVSGLSQQEVMAENEKVIQQTKEFERKIRVIVDLIEDMERQYEDSKRFIVVQRYRLMKTMIKQLINNQWIWCWLHVLDQTLWYRWPVFYHLFFMRPSRGAMEHHGTCKSCAQIRQNWTAWIRRRRVGAQLSGCISGYAHACRIRIRHQTNVSSSGMRKWRLSLFGKFYMLCVQNLVKTLVRFWQL